jgi:hypothetical protein
MKYMWEKTVTVPDSYFTSNTTTSERNSWQRKNVSGCAWQNCFLSADQVDNNGAEDESVQEHDRLAVRIKITSRGLHAEIMGFLWIWIVHREKETKVLSSHSPRQIRSSITVSFPVHLFFVTIYL